MPYLAPEHVLRQFATYLQEDVRDAIDDDHKFVKAQVGSMSSSLSFLAMELDSLGEDLSTQQQALLDALDDAESELGTIEDPASVAETITTSRERVQNTELADSYAFERELTEAVTAVFESLDELPEDDARRVRKPLYSFLETRVTTQLEALGGER